MLSQGHVVLLHAFPLNAGLWRPQVERAPTGWRFVTPDLPGFATSGLPPARTMEEMAREVLNVIDEQGIARAVIGGVSMGAYVTLALYRLVPERFSAMILADTRATADNDQQIEGRRKMIATVREKGPSAIADEMLPKLLGATSHRVRPELAGRLRAMIEGNSRETIAGAVEAMMGRADSRPLLAQISVPTLVLCGEEDVLTPPSDSEALHAGIRGSRLAMLPGAGHLPNFETPDAFSFELNAFLGELPNLALSR
ncbi:MAG TPA: alpha/beta fold hydrolase [Vicinamibacterales bacterium]|nr:alpha/beta fold hydrolase [Vicinamibacterales bacterium]